MSKHPIVPSRPLAAQGQPAGEVLPPAERGHRSQSEFLSSMSHELRSPLNAILGFAQLMEFETPAPSPSQKESIAQILQAGWHLLNLLNEILDLAKIDSGKLSLSAEPVALGEVLQECQGLIDGQAQKRGLTLSFPMVDCHCYVQADRTRLKQVLINLLSNAVKYNRTGGTVAVSCLQTPSGRLRISIHDSGDGLSQSQVEQLFQPFNRLGQEARGEEGAGIGLVVAKQLIELMGGAIGVDSTLGVGSVFWFELMVGIEPQLAVGREGPGIPVPVEPVASSSARLVLYVEDNPANLALVEQLISLELAQAAQPRVILMDINLPDGSGIGVLAELRKDPGTADIPVIALSANAMPYDIAKGLEAGFFRYLTKPIRINEFYETVDAALAHAEAGDSRTEGVLS